MHNIKIPYKNKSLSLFHVNTCSLNRNFDDPQHLFSCTKKKLTKVKQESENKYLY